MLDYILYGICALVLGIASITDIRTREVPDYLNFSFVTGVIGIRLIYALHTQSWDQLFSGLIGMIIYLVLANLMFYTGQWGGGDAKMLVGLGAVFGFSYSITHDLVTFFVNLFFVGALYGFVWSMWLLVTHFTAFQQTFMRKIRKHRRLLTVAVTVSILLFFTSFFSLYGWIFALMGFSILLISLLLQVVKSIEEVCMIKEVPISKVTEGDWIVHDIVIDGTYITGPKELGIRADQLLKLQKLSKQKKISTVVIKEGIPFIPSFLLAFIATFVYGSYF